MKELLRIIGIHSMMAFMAATLAASGILLGKKI